jgi:hypothetical protein
MQASFGQTGRQIGRQTAWFYGCIVIGIVGSTSGCAVEDGQPIAAVASSEHALATENGLMLKNGLRFDDGLRLQDGELLEHGLAVGHGLSIDYGLSSEQGLSSTTGFLTSEAGQELVRYLVECTLPLGRSITKNDPIQGGIITFEGYVGLAPAWENAACDRDCQQWVSACLLARTNALGQSRSIELVAIHPAIGSRRTRPWTYLFEEAGFYGNLFLDPPSTHACLGSGGALSALQTRLCGLVPWLTCGFDDVVNTCFLLNECSGRVNDTYVGCRDDVGAAHHTITTYTKLL